MFICEEDYSKNNSCTQNTKNQIKIIYILICNCILLLLLHFNIPLQWKSFDLFGITE